MQSTPATPSHSQSLSQRLTRVLPIVSLLVFGFALWGVHEVLRHYRYHEVIHALQEIPARRIGLSLALTCAAYVALTGYDFLALRYIRHPLRYRRIGLASFVSYAFSQTLGLALVIGASMRYRLYSAWGIAATDIARIVAFCWTMFWLGMLTVAGTALIVAPAVATQIRLAPAVARMIGVACYSVVAAYLIATIWIRRPITIRGLNFRVPAPRLALAQLAVSCSEWLLAASVLYVLLPAGAAPDFVTFAGLFVVSQAVGVASHVPGGLGVFESMILLLTRSRVPPTAVAGALLAYRGIYYILPLSIAIATVGVHEIGRRAVRVRHAAGVFGRWVPQLAPAVFAMATFTAGAILIFSGATPAMQERLDWLEAIVPLPLLELSHFLGSLTGVGLLLLAQGLQRRLDAAWALTSALLAAGIGFSLLKGADYEEAIVLAVVLAALLPCRRFFYRRGSLIAERFTPGWLIMITVVIAGSIWLVHFAFRHIEYASDVWWQFEFSRQAPRALRAAVGTLAALVIVGIARLLRPAPPEPAALTPADLERARAIIASSPNADANLALLGDKQLLFNGGGTGFVMYGVEGRSWVALRDPICPPNNMAELAWAFRELVDRHAGCTVFYEVGRAHLPVYVDLGLALLKLGEEARVQVPTFTLEGSHRAGLRRFHRVGIKAGCRFEVIPPNEIGHLLPQLRQVSDEWLTLKKSHEKGFSLGSFNERNLLQFPVGVVYQNGRVIAFANLWPSGQREELTVDLMRYVPNAPQSIMTYLFVELILWAKAQEFEWFNLGMAPLSGLERRKLAPLWSRLGGFVFHHGEHFYNFQGLRQYKERFDPVWEPRYLAGPSGLALPRVLTNVATLIGGGVRGVLTR